MIRIAINGFGRIGRPTLKIALEKENIEVAAINDLADDKTLAHLLKYDSSYGTYGKSVETGNGEIIVGGKKIRSLTEPDPTKLPWKDFGVDIVLECSGAFTKKEDAEKHIGAGAAKVILSAPPSGDGVPVYLLGINENEYNPAENVISNGSCTTNCLAPMIKVLDEKFRQRTAELKKQQNTRLASGLPKEAVIKTISFTLSKVEYEFWEEKFSFSTIGMFMLAFIVGVIGGTYGIGGGAIIAPFCIAVFHLPVYTVAGAALMGTFLTSIAGVTFYSIMPARGGLSTSPDWLLGLLLGAGGFVGMYLGARFQKFVPQQLIKIVLGLIIIFLSIRYILQFFV